MPTHNSVPTTCTASHLTGWSIGNLKSADPKAQVSKRIETVQSLINSGFKSDFALIYAVTTKNQVNNYGLDEFLPKCGFEMVFEASKKLAKGQRHTETGELLMWCTTPFKYEESLKSYLKELVELKEKIDPPKKPDPERQKYPELRLLDLRKAGLVYDNSILDNVISSTMTVDKKTIENFIKIKFGMDIKKQVKTEWTEMSFRQLKNIHKSWKEELV